MVSVMLYNSELVSRAANHFSPNERERTALQSKYKQKAAEAGEAGQKLETY